MAEDPYDEVRRPVPDEVLDQARYAAELAHLTGHQLADNLLASAPDGPPKPMLDEILRRVRYLDDVPQPFLPNVAALLRRLDNPPDDPA